jgi:hypothetical protein
MKKFFLFVMLLFSLQTILKAQTFNNEYGKVGKDDIDYKSDPQDKSAEAVVISDDGQSYFSRINDEFEIIYERTTRIKVLNEAGIKYANIEIPFYGEGEIYENVYDVEACTYNFENGVFSRTDLDLNTCHDEKINKYWNIKKFAMPNVKVGSIIEYRYKISSEYLFKLRNWNFQWKIPVIYSRYITKMIPFYQYTWLLQGANKFDSQKTYEDPLMERQYGSTKFKDLDYEFVMRNLPGFKDEEFISSDDDYLVKLNFQLSKVIDQDGVSQNVITTWPEMIKDLIKNEDFGGFARKSEGIASKIFELKSLSLLPAQQKFDSILDFVKANFTWNKLNDKYASKSPRAFQKDKNGNNADINLFAIGLLNAVGIKAVPVILSTRDNGKIKYDYPFTHFFNYIVIMADIDGKKVLSDATNPLSKNDRIPEKCINDKGLIIQKDKVEWVGLQTVIPTKTQKAIMITVSDSTQNAVIQSSSTEYSALDNRTDYGTNTHIINKYLLNKGYSVVDSSIIVKNQNDIKMPYILKYSINDKPEKVNNKIYVSPFLHEIIADSPLKQPNRSYPIDMIYPHKTSAFSEITIPDGYKVDFLPANDKINNDQFEFDYTTAENDKKISVSMIYYFKEPVYDASEYSKIKYYFNEIVNKGSEKIVFVKN